MRGKFRPLAVKDDIVAELVGDELLVYDGDRHVAARLNQTAALVWEHADGRRTVAELVEVLREELGEAADEDLVLIALDRLSSEGLIASGYVHRDPDTAGISRRRFIRRVGVAGVTALLLPVVQSMAIPTAAAAASGPFGQ